MTEEEEGAPRARKSVGFMADSRPRPKEGTKIDFLQDDPSEMTRARRMALEWMKKYEWYNPKLKRDDVEEEDDTHEEGTYRSPDGYPLERSKMENPSLEKAWAFFEHVALPRYVVEPSEKKHTGEKKNIFLRIFRRLFCKGDVTLSKAEPGENQDPTRLYDPIFTPHNQLGDFGLGIGLYFSTVRAFSVILLVAGLIHFPNFIYYASSAYNSEGQAGLELLLRGSAVCVDRDWVPCPNCTSSDPVIIFETKIFGECNESISSCDDDDNIPQFPFTLVEKNNCEGATYILGFTNMAALAFLVVACLILNWYLEHMEIKFDEDEQTAQDYSVTIDNPPEDATDPDEWRIFFEDILGAKLAGCTVAVDNDLLVRALVRRREAMRKLELMVEPGTSLDVVTLAGLAAADIKKRYWYENMLAGFVPGFPEIFGDLVTATAQVQGLAQQDYRATEVMVTFEYEKDQRRILQDFDIGAFAIDSQRGTSLPEPKYLFRDYHVLDITEAEEPETIRWQDLNADMTTRLKEQFYTTSVTVILIILVAIILDAINNTFGFLFISTSIAVFNVGFPMVAKALTSIESHPSEGNAQTSLYFKIAIFRWTVTAIIITYITPFQRNLSPNTDGLIKQVNTQFYAEITTTAVLQLSDYMGHINRHILAPRATTQDAMNLFMTGTPFELAERYTNVSKLVFLAVWYCALFPNGLFLCAFSLQIIYVLDRISLMRSWKKIPRLGTSISEFNRMYFLPLIVLVMAIFSSYYWSGFPFDNVCLDEGVTVDPKFFGEYNVSTPTGETFNLETFKPEPTYEHVIVEVNADTEVYKPCIQDFLRTHGRRAFPFVPDNQPPGGEWMNSEQEGVCAIYGLLSMLLMVSVILGIVYNFLSGIRNYFIGSYDPTGDDQEVDFHKVKSMSLYIPQVESSVYPYPLLAAEIDNIGEDMLDWIDPERDFAFYDLTRDAQVLLRGLDITGKTVFSMVSHWPPLEWSERHVTASSRDAMRRSTMIDNKALQKALLAENMKYADLSDEEDEEQEL